MFDRNQAWELSLFALVIWLEARGETFEGKVAVAWSIRNRVFKKGKQWYGNDWEEVILKKWQYSSFNKDDPNYGKLPGDPAKDPSWAQSLLVAEQVYTAELPDTVNGATHYYAVWMDEQGKTPSWANAPDSVFIKRVGGHKFYIAA